MLIPIILYVITFGVYVWLWYLLIFKKQRYAMGISQFVVKVALTVPFWALFLYFSLIRLVPPVYRLINPVEQTQEFIIKNNTGKQHRLAMLRRIGITYKWFPATPRENKLSPFVSPAPGETVRKVYRTDQYNKLYLEICDKRTPVDTLRYARAFDISQFPTVVYLSELMENPIRAVDPVLIDQTHDIILSFVAIIGIWYHFLTRKKIIARILAGAGGLVVSAISGYLIYSSALVYMYYF